MIIAVVLVLTVKTITIGSALGILNKHNTPSILRVPSIYNPRVGKNQIDPAFDSLPPESPPIDPGFDTFLPPESPSIDPGFDTFLPPESPPIDPAFDEVVSKALSPTFPVINLRKRESAQPPVSRLDNDCAPSQLIGAVHPVALMNYMKKYRKMDRMRMRMLSLYTEMRNEPLLSTLNPHFYTTFVKFNLEFDEYFRDPRRFEKAVKDILAEHLSLTRQRMYSYVKPIDHLSCNAWKWYNA